MTEEIKKLGVVEFEKALFLLVELGNVADKMVQSKKQGASTLKMLTHVIDIADEVYDVVKMDFKQLKLEILDGLQDEDRLVLKEAFKAKFDITDDVLEGKIELGIDILEKIGAIVFEVIEYSKMFKKAE